MSSEKNYLNDSYKSFFEDSLSLKDPELYKAINDELIPSPLSSYRGFFGCKHFSKTNNILLKMNKSPIKW